MLKLWLLINYVKHWLEAKNRHGVHSPFVYRLIDEVIYDRRPKRDYLEIENLRSAVLTDSHKLVAYKGVGRGVHPSLDSPVLAQLLYRLSTHFLPNRIIELGISSGRAAAYITKASAANNVESSDFILINNSYGEVAARSYLEECLVKINDKSLIALDAIYQNKEMKALWRYIKSHPQVTVTIDLFWIGLVFVRPTQAKEHFKIRF